MSVINGAIVVDPFLIHSPSCNWYILYLIAIDIKRQNFHFVTRVEGYDELKELKIRIHDSAFVSIAYRAVRGRGVRLPAIECLPTIAEPHRIATAAADNETRTTAARTTATTTTTTTAAVATRGRTEERTSRLAEDEAEDKSEDRDGDDGDEDAGGEMCSAIQRVGDRITELFDDDTLRPQAINIAQYLLKCESMSLERILCQLGKPGARDVLRKLLNCSSDLLSSDPRALGVDISNCIVSEKIQKSLDIKSVSAKNSTMAPKIKHSILHSHPESIWIRFYSAHPDITSRGILEDKDYHIITICRNVYEFYINKTCPEVDLIRTNLALQTLERCYDADIIFCSELSYFSYNKLLFISNYVKFTWCYLLDRQIFNPSTAKDFKTLCVYMMHSLLFLKSNNLAHMSTATHNPLIAYTGERPRTAMNKFDTQAIYQAEGHRAMMTIDKSGDFGSKSNHIEIISDIKIDHSILDSIV